MTGRDFITFAERIASQSYGPAGYRSAVSRAYYGCFHVAKAALNQFGWHCHGGNEHQWVQRHFLNCATEDFIDIGNLLQNLHESRKRADYDLDDRFIGKADAENSVVRAIELENKIASATKGASKNTIRLEMEIYRKKVGLT